MPAPAITKYTTYDDVRALLGASVDEIPDKVVDLQTYKYGLNSALKSIAGILSPDTVERDLVAQHTYISALVSPTEDQELLKEAIEMYASYIVADLLADSISMSMPKTQTDGKSSLTRFSAQDTYISVRTNIKNALSRYTNIINGLLGITSTTMEYLKVVVPAIDIVTGETPT